jgi:hypothetical protein
VATNDTVQLSVIGTVGGQNHVHTLHFRYLSPTPTDGDLAADYRDNMLTSYKAMFATGDSPSLIVRVAQVCGTVPLRAPAEVSPATTAGTRSLTGIGEPLPTWLASVSSVRTAFAGRSRRGRFYIGGLYEWDVFQNILTGALTPDSRSELLAVYTAALLARYGPGNSNLIDAMLVVHSPTLAAVPGTQCQDSSTEVTGIINRETVGSMKSRKPGSGT